MSDNPLPESTDTPQQELSYNSREYGKSFKAWQIFIASSRSGESAVYRTKEGDICSPKRVEQLVNSEVLACLERLVEPTINDIFPSKPYDGSNTHSEMVKVIDYYKTLIDVEKRRYEHN